MKQRLIRGILAHEAERQRHAGHRQRRGAAGNSCNRHRAMQPRKRSDVTRASLMVDRARHKKERALVARVCDEVHERRGNRLACADAEKHRQDAKRAHC